MKTIAILSILGAAGLASMASGVVIWSQATAGRPNGYVAQQFGPSFACYDTYEFDEFSTAVSYNLTTMVTPGFENGNSALNTDVVAEIWSNLPDRGGSLQASAHGGTEDGAGTTTNNFAGASLGAGSHYGTSYIVGDFAAGRGQWFWEVTYTVTGAEELFYNPGGCFGYGSASINGSTVFGVSADMVVELQGTSAGATLSKSGSCPGSMTFTVSGATAGGTVAFIYAFGTGSVTIPSGTCSGTVLGLNGSATLGATATANGSGVAAVTRTIPAAACGNVFLQGLNVPTCGTTNVISI